VIFKREMLRGGGELPIIDDKELKGNRGVAFKREPAKWRRPTAPMLQRH